MTQTSWGIKSSPDETKGDHSFGGVTQVRGLLRCSQKRADLIEHLRLLQSFSAQHFFLYNME